jgi:hypothetical protein
MRRREFLEQTALAAAALCAPSPTTFAFGQRSLERRGARYFIGTGEEFDRIHAGSPRIEASGAWIFTDSRTGEQWEEWYNWFSRRWPLLAGLVRCPFPSVDTLFDICRGSNDLDEVAFASLALNESVDSRWRLLDLVEALIEQSRTSARLKVLLDNGVFEFPLCHESLEGMWCEEIKRQHELSKQCAERAKLTRKRLPSHSRFYDEPV